MVVKEKIDRSERAGISECTATRAFLGLTRSPSIWLVIFLYFASLYLSQISFHRLLEREKLTPETVTKAAALFKLSEWKAKQTKTEIVFVGSSLPMCGLYYADAEKDGPTYLRIKAKQLNVLQAYTAANYLQSALKRKTGRDVSVFNATNAASMISDNHLVISKLLDKPPQKIVLCVGMRDFADNVNGSFGGTPIFHALFDLQYATHKDNLSFLLKNARSSVLKDLFLNLAFPCYSSHNEIGQLLRDNTDKLLKKNGVVAKTAQNKEEVQISNNASALASESSTTTHTTAEKTKTSLDQLDYRKRYAPTNYKQMELEKHSLERTCQLCKDAKIELILVNMPVSSGHQALASKEMHLKYLSYLDEVSTKYGVKYVNFENAKIFSDNDFLDTVHIGPTGAVKFLDYLVGESGIFNN